MSSRLWKWPGGTMWLWPFGRYSGGGPPPVEPGYIVVNGDGYIVVNGDGYIEVT